MKAYAIKSPKWVIIIRTIKQFRDECIDNYESHLSIAPWIIRKKEGYRCVPVLITEVKK